MKKIYPADSSGELFDHIKRKKNLRLEGDLAEFLGEHRSIISEIRHGKRLVNSELLIRICEKTGISFKKAKSMIESDSSKQGA